jgi:hypothetical protein
MQERNLVRQPFWIVLFTFLVFFGLSFVKTEATVGGYAFKRIDLLSEVRFHRKIREIPVPDILFTERMKDSMGILIRMRDKLSVINFSEEKFGAMEKFYQALIKRKNGEGTVRIGYFGDSMIEGDLLTMDLRSFFQKQFGGRGVGFVPVTSVVSGFRTTIRHSFSPDWTVYHFNNDGGAKHPLGPSGYCFIPAPGSWVKYGSTNYSGGFSSVKLYYGKGDSLDKIKVVTPDAETGFTLDGGNAINQLVLNSTGTANLRVDFKCGVPLNVYGFSFESGPGVYLDNYSFRGNSGLPLTMIPQNIYSGFDTHLGYDLIILHYGLNVVAHNIKDYNWYKIGLRNMLAHVKNAFPNASILLVSVNDKAYREPTGWETEPDIPILVNIQKAVAEEKKIAFWNLYENMGGYNSMVHWAEGDTVYSSDYIHPNSKGGNRIALMMYKKIMEQFALYEKSLKLEAGK